MSLVFWTCLDNRSKLPQCSWCTHRMYPRCTVLFCQCIITTGSLINMINIWLQASQGSAIFIWLANSGVLPPWPARAHNQALATTILAKHWVQPEDQRPEPVILAPSPELSFPPFTPVIRNTTSADKAIKISMLCPAALSHQKSYFGSERDRLTLPELSARWRQSWSCD